MPRRKTLDSLLWRIRLRAVNATLDTLLQFGLLSDDLSAAGQGKGLLVSGRLGSNALDRAVFVETLVRELAKVPPSIEEPIQLLDDVTPYEITIHSARRADG